MKILVVGGATGSLLLFRGALLREMVARGHTVFACGGDEHRATINALSQAHLGRKLHDFLQSVQQSTGASPTPSAPNGGRSA